MLCPNIVTRGSNTAGDCSFPFIFISHLPHQRNVSSSCHLLLLLHSLPSSLSHQPKMSPRDGTPTSTSTDGTAWPWILEHFLTYPSTFEIPLRTMFAINLTPTLSSGSTPETSTPYSSFPGQHLSGQNASDHFKECLLNHLKQLPSRQVSLPASFISSYVRKCFPQELCDVDFTMALTALDYLKDLESRRRRELAHVFERLGLEKNGLGEAGLEVDRAHLDWAVSMQGKDEKVESLYTEVYVGLRRWVRYPRFSTARRYR